MRRAGCSGFTLIVLVAAGLLAWLAGGWWVTSRLDKPIGFTVSKGTSLASAATALEQAGAIGSRRSFLLRAKLLGSSDGIQAGEFALPAGASEARILDILQHGQPLHNLLTIPEGMPSIMVWERLNAEKDLTGTIPVPEEGSLLPDSYDFQKGESRAAVVARMQKAMRDFLATAWGKRGPGAVVNTSAEAVTLASVVEKETGRASERPMVAGVMSNRLRIGMALGADATAIYPITKGKPLGRMIRVSELRDPNPYNTRAIRGLPIGPITNPGREAIAAVLNPAKTDALYYVADGTGGHVFANTLAEHNANVAKWRALRRARGEM